jgi:hypothetical protein
MCSIDLINLLFNPSFICFTFRRIHFILLLTISFPRGENCVEWIEFKFVERKGLRGLQKCLLDFEFFLFTNYFFSMSMCWQKVLLVSKLCYPFSKYVCFHCPFSMLSFQWVMFMKQPSYNKLHPTIIITTTHFGLCNLHLQIMY